MWLAGLWFLRLVVLTGMGLFLGRIATVVWREAALAARETAEHPEAQGTTATLRVIKTTEDRGAFSSATGFRLSPGEELPVMEGLTVGRGEENDLVLHDGFVSSRHARIIRQDGAWWLEDSGSRNGTIVNGRRVKGKVRLRSGDRITVGSNSFSFTG